MVPALAASNFPALSRECPVKEYHDGQWWTKGDGKGYGANAMDYVPPVATTTTTPPMAMTTTPHNHFDGIPLGGFASTAAPSLCRSAFWCVRLLQLLVLCKTLNCRYAISLLRFLKVFGSS